MTLAERRVEALEGENKVLKADRDFQMTILEERQHDQAAQVCVVVDLVHQSLCMWLRLSLLR